MAQSPLNRRRVLSGLLVAISLWLGCETPTVPLEQRVREYWTLRKERNFDAAYELEDARQGPDKSAYLMRLAGSNVVFVTVRVVGTEVQDGEARVSLNVVYRLPQLPKSLNERMTDSWLKVDGQWYHRMPFSTENDKQEPRDASPKEP